MTFYVVWVIYSVMFLVFDVHHTLLSVLICIAAGAFFAYPALWIGRRR